MAVPMESDNRALAAIILLIGLVKLRRRNFMTWPFRKVPFLSCFREVHARWCHARHPLELRNAYTSNAHAH